MAKRGETFGWTVRFEWENGVTGSRRFHSEQDAQDFAKQQSELRGPNGESCTATVKARA